MNITLRVIMAIMVIFIFGVSIMYFIRSPSNQTLLYNNYQFEKIDKLWYVQWQNGGKLLNIPAHYHPTEVLDIPHTGALNDTFKQNTIYFTFDPDGPQESFKYIALATSEIGIALSRGLGREIEVACTKTHTQCKDTPIVTCGADDKAVVYLKQEEKPQILFQGNCIRVYGNATDMMKAADKLLYFWLGIIQ